MEYYNGKLCVTYDDLAGIATMNAIQCIVKKDASIQARKACRSNTALFDLDRLPLKFQLEVYRRRLDLKAQAESKPFVESITSSATESICRRTNRPNMPTMRQS